MHPALPVRRSRDPDARRRSLAAASRHAGARRSHQGSGRSRHASPGRADARVSFTAMEQRPLGRSGLRGLPARARHHDLGPRTPTRTTRPRSSRRSSRPAAPCIDTADVYGDGDAEEVIGVAAGQPGAARRRGDRDEGRPAPGHGAPPRRARAGTCCARSTRRCAGSAPTTSTSGRCTATTRTRRWRRRCPRWTTRSHRAGSATSACPTSPAGRPPRPRPGRRAWPGRAPIVSAQVEYSLLERGIEREVLPACEALGLGRAALVAARPRRAHRQVPQRPAGRLARRVAALRAVRRAVPGPALLGDRRGGGHRRGRARRLAARGRAGLGAGPARRGGADPRRPHRRAAARRAADRGDRRCRRRSAGRWTTCRRSVWAIPSARADRRRDGEPAAARHASGCWPDAPSTASGSCELTERCYQAMPGSGRPDCRRRSSTWRVPSRRSLTLASSQSENSAAMVSCAAAAARSMLPGSAAARIRSPSRYGAPRPALFHPKPPRVRRRIRRRTLAALDRAGRRPPALDPTRR